MPRTSGLMEAPAEAWEAGSMHRPNLVRIQDRLAVDPKYYPYPDAEQLAAEIDGLAHGTPVTSNEFDEILGRTRVSEVYPGKTLDESRSAHQVSFGRFVGYKPSKRHSGTVLSVAYKPFDDPAKALQEFHGYGLLHEVGVETFRPVGVFPSEGRQHFIVVTEKRNDLMSLDRDEWVVGRQPHSARETEIAERNTKTIQDVAKVMAHLHSLGIFHPDGQIKNYAITPNGVVGVIDTENLHKVENPDLALEKAWGDIEKLVKSLIALGSTGNGDKIFGVGMLGKTQLPTVRQACEELIFTPYLKQLDAAIENRPQDADNLTSLGVEVAERFKDWNEWPDHLIEVSG